MPSFGMSLSALKKAFSFAEVRGSFSSKSFTKNHPGIEEVEGWLSSETEVRIMVTTHDCRGGLILQSPYPETPNWVRIGTNGDGS